MTRQRQLILDELRRTKTHPTAGELYVMVRKRLPNISLGTIYRNLEQLARNGEVRKLGGATKEARFDGDLSDHYHVRCSKCGRVVDFNEPPEIAISQAPAECRGWRIDRHRIEFVGLCPECRGCVQ